MRILTSLTLLVALALPASAAILTVDSSADDGVGCTLRNAVEAANTNAPVGACSAGEAFPRTDEIRFTVGSVTLTAGRIVISENVDVIGPVTITAAPRNGIFRMGVPTAVSFTDIIFQGGFGNGGALDIFGNTAVTVTGGAATYNTAPLRGGAFSILSNNASLDITGTSFTGNRARGDRATEGGGAIYTSGGTVTVESATFTDNRAIGTLGSGGAILNPNGADLSIQGSTFADNRSQRAGGAIETVGGTMSIIGGSFTGNIAGTNPGNGGAVHGGGFAEVLIRDNIATGNRAVEGGAFWISADGSLGLIGVTVESNVATGASADQGGGGVYVDGGILTIVDGLASSRFSNNRATGASGSGGAILVNDGAVSIENATFDQNRSRRAGGAIEVTAPTADEVVELVIVGGVFSQNSTGRAPGNGGAIHTTQGEVDFDMDSVTFSGNEAFSEGGGVWINTGTSLVADGLLFDGNVARGTAPDNGGGGLFVNGGSASIRTSTFTGNRSLAEGVPGGGIHVVGGSATVFRSLLTENTASHGGAGAASTSGQLHFANSTLYANSARFGGAGYSGNSLLSFDSATIASNSATIAGGGLYNQNPPNQGVPTVSLENTIVADNTAPNGADLRGRHRSQGYNLIGTVPDASTFPTMATDQTGVDPLLGPLQDNGGPTRTAALGAGSPALDAGNTLLAVDQRGVTRTAPKEVGAFDWGGMAPPAGPALVITGVVDGPLSGGVPKAITFYVLEDIADLSRYGVGSANNGGGTDGIEFVFPAVAVSAGTSLTLASEAPGFTAFFGVAPDYTSSAASLNGDDAVELFYDPSGAVVGATVPATTSVVDTFGEPDVNGTGEAWEYLDGWAYRTDATGPDGGFVLGNWSFSGVDALDGETTNATAATPFPIGTYSPAGARAPARMASAVTATLDALIVVPNPFGSRAQATFALTEAQAVTVTLYDVMGRHVQQVFAGQAEATQTIEASIDGGALASGVYVLVLQGETVRATRQVTVAR